MTSLLHTDVGQVLNWFTAGKVIAKLKRVNLLLRHSVLLILVLHSSVIFSISPQLSSMWSPICHDAECKSVIALRSLKK